MDWKTLVADAYQPVLLVGAALGAVKLCFELKKMRREAKPKDGQILVATRDEVSRYGTALYGLLTMALIGAAAFSPERGAPGLVASRQGALGDSASSASVIDSDAVPAHDGPIVNHSEIIPDANSDASAPKGELRQRSTGHESRVRLAADQDAARLSAHAELARRRAADRDKERVLSQEAAERATRAEAIASAKAASDQAAYALAKAEADAAAKAMANADALARARGDADAKASGDANEEAEKLFEAGYSSYLAGHVLEGVRKMERADAMGAPGARQRLCEIYRKPAVAEGRDPVKAENKCRGVPLPASDASMP